MEKNENRLFVFIHGDESEQESFLKECNKKGKFAEKINFMVRQKPISLYRSGNEVELDKKLYVNGQRPYLTVSNANPDHIGEYFNWTYLESAIESGWRSQFGEVL